MIYTKMWGDDILITPIFFCLRGNCQTNNHLVESLFSFCQIIYIVV